MVTSMPWTLVLVSLDLVLAAMILVLVSVVSRGSV